MNNINICKVLRFIHLCIETEPADTRKHKSTNCLYTQHISLSATDTKMNDAEQQQSTLDFILSGFLKVASVLLPDWKPPVLEHPFAKHYVDGFKLLDNIIPGDQIMVRAVSGYWHHGIYVGKQPFQDVTGEPRLMEAVVDFWGVDKENSNIATRPFSDFVSGGATMFAKADYPEGAAFPKDLSAKLALAYACYFHDHPTSYHLLLNNCEIFATMCRCLRSVVDIHDVKRMLCEYHDVLCRSLHVPITPKQKCTPGFK